MDGNYVTFRCPAELRDQLERIGADNDRKLSAEIRRACWRYVHDYNANYLVGPDGKTTYVRPTA